VIGGRTNDLEKSLPWLEKAMPPEAYQALRIIRAPASFLEAVPSSAAAEF
jgi:hypothetical protein